MDKKNQDRLDEADQKQLGETDQKGPSKPYDSAFKSIVQKCPRLALFLINEMFYQRGLTSKEYDGTEQVRLLNGELTDLKDGNLEEDTRLDIEKGGVFHFECESSPGNARVMLRVVQYQTRNAVDNMEMDEDGGIQVQIDNSGVLFLRSTLKTPKMVTVNVKGPQGSSMSYQIPALSLKDYTLKTVLEKKLYILLPFLFFNYEKELKEAKDPQNYAVIDTLWGQIIDQLKEKTEDESINAYEKSTLYDALQIVVKALGRKNKATKEVEKIMGGKVLEFSGDKLFNEGREAERKEWQEERKEWQKKEKEWQKKDKERQKEIESLRKKLKETNGMPGFAT